MLPEVTRGRFCGCRFRLRIIFVVCRRERKKLRGLFLSVRFIALITTPGMCFARYEVYEARRVLPTQKCRAVTSPLVPLTSAFAGIRLGSPFADKKEREASGEGLMKAKISVGKKIPRVAVSAG